MKTTEFTASIGVVSGYCGDTMLLEASAHDRTSVGVIWQQCAAEVAAETGIYVSAVIYESAALYSPDWGCPNGGEPVFTVTGTRNAQFCPDDEAWRTAVLDVIRKMKLSYRQSTVTVTFGEVEMVYVKEDV